MEPNTSYLCYLLKDNFTELSKILIKEMEATAFTTSDYDTLRIEHAYLNRLVQRISNEASDNNQ